MKHYSLFATLVAALIGLSGCIAYPIDDYPARGDRGDDRGRDRDHRSDSHDDNRDRSPNCDPRISDCGRH